MGYRLNVTLLLGILLLLAVVAPTLYGLFHIPHDPVEISIADRFSPPSEQNLFGTDHLGRDVFSRLLVGGRVTLTIGIAAVVCGFAVGWVLGLVSGYYGGPLDELLMRIADGLYSFPALLLALLAITVFGAGPTTAGAAIAIANVPVFLRLTRNLVLSLREQRFVEAAKALGASDVRIIFYHIMPNAAAPLLVQASASFAAAVLVESSLSYLGLGVQPPAPSWGRMLRDSQSFMTNAPWTVFFPALAIAFSVLGFNLLGDSTK